MHSTFVQSALGLEQPRSSEHSDFQQQESGNCWGIELLDAAESRILVQLATVSAYTAAEQDGTPVQLKM
jgi:hypothetical protein